MAPKGDLATGLWEAKGLSKRTFEASGFSQPCGQISLSRNLDLCPSLRVSSSVAGFFAVLLRVQTSQGLTPQKTPQNLASSEDR